MTLFGPCACCGSREERPIRLSRLAGVYKPGEQLCVGCRDRLRHEGKASPAEAWQLREFRTLKSYSCWRNPPRQSAS